MKILGLILIVWASNANSTQFKNATSKESYFYSIPEESGNEWAYSVPECSKLEDTEKTSTKKCETFGDHKSCITNKDIELVNLISQKKKKFKLIFHVFTSLKNCTTDRATALNGE
ncbi:MAG: hypothetical protein KBD76_15875 [Bacteriovorax sp.]|jgi:hypothetical protein|nr:hypothetical protein [Bacteriovorax sp.]